MRSRRDDGTLVGFVAGPSPTDPRFQGETRYYKSAVPEFVSLFGDGQRPDWTAAFGHLSQFWVDSDELVAIDAGSLDKYAPAKKP